VRKTAFGVAILQIFGWLFLWTIGCRIFPTHSGENLLPGGGTAAPNVVGTTKGVSFRVVLPETVVAGQGSARAAAPDTAIRSLTGAASPTVTFKIVLIDLDGVEKTVKTLQKIVPVDASGTARAEFSSIPAQTAIGDIHIDGGRIGSYTDFHGVADLRENVDNIIDVAPKGLRSRIDVLAELLGRLVADPAKLNTCTPGLASRLGAAIEHLDLASPDIYQTAMTRFLTFTGTMAWLETTLQSLLTTRTIPVTGGTVTVASATSPLNGLVVDVPADAFAAPTTVTVESAVIASHALGVNIDLASPLIVVNTGGLVASVPLELTIPVSLGVDDFPMPFKFDSRTGRLEALPMVDLATGSVTLATRNFGTSFVCPSIRSEIFQSAVNGGILVLRKKAGELDGLTVVTDFRPGVDDWQVPNWGSIVSPRGFGGGLALGALWYYLDQTCRCGAMALFGRYDNDGPLEKTGMATATPALWQDDALVVRFVSVLQNRFWTSLGSWISRAMAAMTDPWTFRACKFALAQTRRPQYIEVSGRSADNRDVSQALIVYRADAGALWVADPNWPGEQRQITYTDGRFAAYTSGENRHEIASGRAIEFTRVRFIGEEALVNHAEIQALWREFQAGTVGRAEFPVLTWELRGDDGTWVSMPSAFTTATSTLAFSWTCPIATAVAETTVYAANGSILAHQTAQDSSRTVRSVALASGPNNLGLHVTFRDPTTSTSLWTDYCRVQVLRFASSTQIIQRLQVTTLAGIPDGADGTGVAANFKGPVGVAVDDSGTAYVADTGNHTIRKISPSGIVTTLAGKAGFAGSSDGNGPDARFNDPKSVAVDSSGTVFVADCDNRTIRRISPNGTVTTLAGSAGSTGANDGTGTAARFGEPSGIAVDRSGNVFVADASNHIIRQISPEGAVSTFAGIAQSFGSADGPGASATFYYPMGVAVDKSDNVFVVEFGNSAIRRISPLGIVSTFAGKSGWPGSADGLASAARFNEPRGIAVDNSGNVYVGDMGNQLIRKISPIGEVVTLAGKAGQYGYSDGIGEAARFTSPWGVAVDPSGQVLVADYGNSSIRKVASDGVVTTLAGSLPWSDGMVGTAKFDSVYGTFVGSSGMVYVTDSYMIRQISPEGLVTTIAGSSNSGSADGMGASAGFCLPIGIAQDDSGNLFIADSNNQTIRRISPDGMVTTFAGTLGRYGSADGTGTSASFIMPQGLDVDRSGNVYVADTGNDAIRKISPAGVVMTLAGKAGFDGSADGLGDLARFSSPMDVAVDQLGYVYVADWGNNSIRKITPGGMVTTLAGGDRSGSDDGIGTSALFFGPRGVAVDSSGSVFVADTGNNTVRRITPDGVVSTIAGTAGSLGFADGTGPSVMFNHPNDVSVDKTGRVYISDDGNRSVRVGILVP